MAFFEWGWVAAALIVGVVWFVNLYNFMDGIDGIAAVQCLVFCFGVQIVSGGLAGWSSDAVWLLAGATLAFLAFNWAPAKIFMGDVGSNFIGLLIAALVLYLWKTDQVPLIASFILLAGFWFDATWTLCVRMLTGQPFARAHRSHLYQRLAQRFGHRFTTLAFTLFAGGWLLPLALAAAHAWLPGGLALSAALAPLALLSWRLRAGREAAETVATPRDKEETH